MLKNIKMEHNNVYYKEIIHPNEFKKIYQKEKTIWIFSSRITTDTERPFFTFYSKYRKNLSFKEGDVLAIRIENKDKQAQFISKIYKRGKINIPKDIINLLNIKNHQKIKFKIIARDKKSDLNNKKGLIDLYNLEEYKLKIIPRAYDYITIYSKQKTPITLPRFFKINKELLELVYLIHGDGHYQNKLYFSNKIPELHKFVLEKFDNILRIPKNLWKARILISDLSFNNHAKNYWKDRLGLDEGQFYNISKTNLNTSNHGNLRIIIDQTIVSLIFRFIFNQVKSLNKTNSLHALNGLLYAEGGAQNNKNSLHKITLSFNNREKDMFKSILDNLKLKYKIEQNRNFVIEGWENQHLFFKTFLSKNIIPFKIHNQRRNNAIIGFLNHSFTKTMVKYLSVLKTRNNISIREFSNLLGIRNDSVLDTIRKSRYRRFIKLKKKKVLMASISNDGLKLLYLIDKIQKIRRGYMEDRLPFERIKQSILTKKEAFTDEKYGKKPEEKTVEELIQYGIININKPQGPTSHQVSDYVKKILEIGKAGHSGTLE